MQFPAWLCLPLFVLTYSYHVFWNKWWWWWWDVLYKSTSLSFFTFYWFHGRIDGNYQYVSATDDSRCHLEYGRPTNVIIHSLLGVVWWWRRLANRCCELVKCKRLGFRHVYVDSLLLLVRSFDRSMPANLRVLSGKPGSNVSPWPWPQRFGLGKKFKANILADYKIHH